MMMMMIFWVVGCFFVVCGQCECGAFNMQETNNARRKILPQHRSELYVSYADVSRRVALQGIAACLLGTSPVFAQDIKKPYAPLENLLPAMRVKVLIDTAASTAKAINDDGPNKAELIAQLKSLLLEPNIFMTKEESSVAKRYLEIDTLDDWNKARQKEAQLAKLEPEQVNPVTRLNEGVEQWGERRQFRRLRRQQLALEEKNNIRAAFNAYTNNLVFGDSYLLTASRDERSRLIRTYDQLPDVTSVIRSDLDLRDLYRNQVLTKIDDSKAELEYQLKNESEFDARELVTLLSEAQSFCNMWFEFVPEKDATQAMAKLQSMYNR
jgi:hypothetical protein